MTNNKHMSAANAKDDAKLMRAQIRLEKLYLKVRQKGGWRALADHLGLPNVRYAYEFVRKSIVPGNPEIREILMRGKPRRKEAIDMNPEMQRLQYLLQHFHLGKEKAIKKKDLLVELFGPHAVIDKSYNNPYDRSLRSMIEELNHDYQGLICSTPGDGYFWASNLSEGLDAMEQSIRRAATQMDNAHHLERNLKQAFGGQLEMRV